MNNLPKQIASELCALARMHADDDLVIERSTHILRDLLTRAAQGGGWPPGVGEWTALVSRVEALERFARELSGAFHEGAEMIRSRPLPPEHAK